MSPAGELRALRTTVNVIAIVIALTVGPLAAFGGLDGMAALFGRDAPRNVDASLRNHFRAICACFAGFGILAAWSLYALEARKTAFRIACGTIVVAGLARITGWIADGYPGAPALAFLTIEVVVFPMLLLWHTRLLRLGRSAHRA